MENVVKKDLSKQISDNIDGLYDFNNKIWANKKKRNPSELENTQHAHNYALRQVKGLCIQYASLFREEPSRYNEISTIAERITNGIEHHKKPKLLYGEISRSIEGQRKLRGNAK